MGLQFRDVTEGDFAPSFGPGKSFGNVRREDKVLRQKDVSLSVLGPTVKFDDDDEVAVKILDDEALGFGLPSALDLNAGRSVPPRISGDQIVSRHVCVGLVRRDALDEELAEHEEFCSFRFKLCVLPWHSLLRPNARLEQRRLTSNYIGIITEQSITD